MQAQHGFLDQIFGVFLGSALAPQESEQALEMGRARRHRAIPQSPVKAIRQGPASGTRWGAFTPFSNVSVSRRVKMSMILASRRRFHPQAANRHYSVWTLLCSRIESCGVRARTILQTLGDEVRERREARDLTQEALAHESGVCRNALAKLEQGRTDSRARTLFKVAIGLKMPLAELIAGVERRQ
jgi:DNA-binding XRE family transcriptional regulator